VTKLPDTLNNLESATRPGKTPAEVEADLMACGGPVPRMLAALADAERTAGLRAVWQVFQDPTHLKGLAYHRRSV
jgi:hypothetical protein